MHKAGGTSSRTPNLDHAQSSGTSGRDPRAPDRSLVLGRRGGCLEHDPEKWVMTIRRKVIALGGRHGARLY
jgi:hypothetical protein